MSNDERQVFRQRWSTRLTEAKLIPATILMNASSRISVVAHEPAVTYSFIVIDIAAFIYVLKTFLGTAQRLAVDETGITLRQGKSVTHCGWNEIAALRRQDVRSKDENRLPGISVECADGRSLALNGTWTIPRKKLVPLLIDRCKTATGKPPNIIGQEAEFHPIRHAGRYALIIVGLLVIPVIGLVTLAGILRHSN